MSNEGNRETLFQRLPAQRGLSLIHLILLDNGDGTSSAYVWDTDNAEYPSTSGQLTQLVNEGLISGEVQPVVVAGGVTVVGDGTPGVLPVFASSTAIKDSRVSQGTSPSDPTSIAGPSIGQHIELNTAFFGLPTVELQAGVDILQSNIRVRMAGNAFVLIETPGGAGAPGVLLIPNNAGVLNDGMGFTVGSVIGQAGDAHSFDIIDKGFSSLCRFTPDGQLLFLQTKGGIDYTEGANARSGLSVLIGGSVTVSNTLITANTRILYAVQTSGGVQGNLSVTKIAGVSFTITSDNLLDTSSVYWQLFEPTA